MARSPTEPFANRKNENFPFPDCMLPFWKAPRNELPGKPCQPSSSGSMQQSAPIQAAPSTYLNSRQEIVHTEDSHLNKITMCLAVTEALVIKSFNEEKGNVSCSWRTQISPLILWLCISSVKKNPPPLEQIPVDLLCIDYAVTSTNTSQLPLQAFLDLLEEVKL